jgi:hypothetical protein
VAARSWAAWLRMSARGSQPDGSLVAALMAEENSPEHCGGLVRFVRCEHAAKGDRGRPCSCRSTGLEADGGDARRTAEFTVVLAAGASNE